MMLASVDLPISLEARFGSREIPLGIECIRDRDIGLGGHLIEENALHIQFCGRREVLPDFFSGEHQDGRYQTGQRSQDIIHRSLGGTAQNAVPLLAVEAILDNIEIEAGHFDNAEIVNGVEFRMVISAW